MAIKKSELYSTLWASCDDLRGGMDASQYKDYVLVLLFIKYVSDKWAGMKFAPITIPDGASFKDMVALKGKKDIGDLINKRIVGPLAKANNLAMNDFPDFSDTSKLGSGKEMVERLSSLIANFEAPWLDFSKNRADGDDILGDAYEYLMRHFATESGKSKGQFYTPAEVSRIMAHVIGIGETETSPKTTVYDPTCGSGSLLLKVADRATTKVSIYGQEKDATTAGLARMNLILHDEPEAEIAQGNTLSSPRFLEANGDLKTFDFVVANPPFSDKRWSTGLHPDEGGAATNSPEQAARNYGRFEGFGIPPAKQGDYAYLLHILRSLKSRGKGACILPHGVLFRGNAEGEIRRNLVKRGLIKAIIGLPANLFYGTGIPACIVVVDKEDAHTRKGIFMIDASRGFRKDGNKNRLRERDIHRIVDAFDHRAEIPGFSRMASTEEIATKHDFNLNLPRYIDGSEPEDLQDIDAHLRGGIPERDIDALDRYWKVFPGVRSALFGKADRPGYVQLKVPMAEVKSTIFDHAEFKAFQASVTKLFEKWKRTHTPFLKGLAKNCKPKEVIATLSEDLLATFEKAPLVDAYDVYQHLMDFWAESMQDDCYMVAADGWSKAAQPTLIVEEKGKKSKTQPDFTIGRQKYTAELVPSSLLIARYFAQEKSAIDSLESQLAAIQQQLKETEEEQGGEGGLLEDAKNDKDKLTKTSVSARLQEIGAAKRGEGPETAEERKALRSYLALVEREAAIASKLKAAQEALIAQVATRYRRLTNEEIQSLVAEDKWLATLAAAVQGELDRVSQTLTGRIRQLAERYAKPLPRLTEELVALASRVEDHLVKMGASWK